MKYTSKIVLNGEEYYFAEVGGWQPGVNTLAYYNINDNDTNSIIYDLSGNGVDQTWYGTPTYDTDATFGRVAVFDGSSYTQASGKINLGNEATVIALTKTSSNSVQAIVTQNAAPTEWPVGLTFDNTYDGACACFSGTGNVNRAGYMPIPLDQRVLLTGTRDVDGVIKFYLNGELKATVQAESNPDYSSGENLQIGRRRSGDAKYLNGAFKLFIGEDRCRTEQEIQTLAREYGFLS